MVTTVPVSVFKLSPIVTEILRALYSFIVRLFFGRTITGFTGTEKLEM